MRKKKVSKRWWVVGSKVLTAVGCVIIPPFIQKMSSKVYKIRSRSEEIDFSNSGPEIVKKERIEVE